ncbi:hypothetical protein [Nocardioides coralli]|uniref:hypothetical protein n=1 Tax=Nocardioides coralli TaxID=2872154 RepID=UPI001CA44B56|nr:hypothetical protein [Nocardioides coralli]QZY29998.1 hypothetical protein K6T13_04740 [Nocardioides coralli]
MHARTGTGYDAAMHTAEPAFRIDPGTQLSTRDDLVALLRDQHDDLRVTLERLPRLAGPARDDEFWQVRRRLAVHHALESLLLATGAARDLRPDLGEAIGDVEQLDTDDSAFAAAARRVLLAHEQHVEHQEPVLRDLAGELTEVERAVAETAVALWLGEGDTYLGHDYRDMVAAARSQLEDASAPGHGPRP